MTYLGAGKEVHANDRFTSGHISSLRVENKSVMEGALLTSVSGSILLGFTPGRTYHMGAMLSHLAFSP